MPRKKNGMGWLCEIVVVTRALLTLMSHDPDSVDEQHMDKLGSTWAWAYMARIETASETSRSGSKGSANVHEAGRGR